jgi:hypothetical protein
VHFEFPDSERADAEYIRECERFVRDKIEVIAMEAMKRYKDQGRR